MNYRVPTNILTGGVVLTASGIIFVAVSTGHPLSFLAQGGVICGHFIITIGWLAMYAGMNLMARDAIQTLRETQGLTAGREALITVGGCAVGNFMHAAATFLALYTSAPALMASTYAVASLFKLAIVLEALTGLVLFLIWMVVCLRKALRTSD